MAVKLIVWSQLLGLLCFFNNWFLIHVCFYLIQPQSFYPGFPMQPPVPHMQSQPHHLSSKLQQTSAPINESPTVYTSALDKSIDNSKQTVETASATTVTTDSVTDTSFHIGSLGGTPQQMFFSNHYGPDHTQCGSVVPVGAFLHQNHHQHHHQNYLQEQPSPDGLSRSASFTTCEQLHSDSPQLRLPRSHAFHSGCWPSDSKCNDAVDHQRESWLCDTVWPFWALFIQTSLSTVQKQRVLWISCLVCFLLSCIYCERILPKCYLLNKKNQRFGIQFEFKLYDIFQEQHIKTSD